MAEKNFLVLPNNVLGLIQFAVKTSSCRDYFSAKFMMFALLVK